MKDHTIYAIVNPQKTKMYIGETSDFNDRKRHHIYYGARGYEKEKFINNPLKEKNGLYMEMKSQGVDKFNFIILEKCSSSEKLEKEKTWIELIGKKFGLYNIADFGGALFGERNGNYGLEFSEGRKQKISESAKERLSTPGNNPKAKKVVAIQNGEVIKEFDTVIETYGWKGFSKRKTYNSLKTGKEYDGIRIDYRK